MNGECSIGLDCTVCSTVGENLSLLEVDRSQ
jgi:hypothetical protein